MSPLFRENEHIPTPDEHITIGKGYPGCRDCKCTTFIEVDEEYPHPDWQDRYGNEVWVIDAYCTNCGKHRCIDVTYPQ